MIKGLDTKSYEAWLQDFGFAYLEKWRARGDMPPGGNGVLIKELGIYFMCPI